MYSTRSFLKISADVYLPEYRNSEFRFSLSHFLLVGMVT